jgi:hypothetical protein
MPDETEAELRRQFRAALEDADYPVRNQMGLLPALPEGASTTFEAGDVRVTAMELASKLDEYQNFPYEDADSLVDDILEGMRAEGLL